MVTCSLTCLSPHLFLFHLSPHLSIPSPHSPVPPLPCTSFTSPSSLVSSPVPPSILSPVSPVHLLSHFPTCPFLHLSPYLSIPLATIPPVHLLTCLLTYCSTHFLTCPSTCLPLIRPSPHLYRTYLSHPSSLSPIPLPVHHLPSSSIHLSAHLSKRCSLLTSLLHLFILSLLPQVSFSHLSCLPVYWWNRGPCPSHHPPAHMHRFTYLRRPIPPVGPLTFLSVSPVPCPTPQFLTILPNFSSKSLILLICHSFTHC